MHSLMFCPACRSSALENQRLELVDNLWFNNILNFIEHRILNFEYVCPAGRCTASESQRLELLDSQRE